MLRLCVWDWLSVEMIGRNPSEFYVARQAIQLTISFSTCTVAFYRLSIKHKMENRTRLLHLMSWARFSTKG
jgi:hypothetical protein